MTNFKPAFLLFAVLLISSCSKQIFELEPTGQISLNARYPDHHLGIRIQHIIDEYVEKGVPGVSVSIINSEGQWEGVAGLAKIENATAMSQGMVHAGGSITKIYTASAVMKLVEQGKIGLEDQITLHLPASIYSQIQNAEKITIRMLLNHKSGIPDYIGDTDFRLHWFNDMSKRWTLTDIFRHLKQKNYLPPGAEYRYSNTNYVLLSLMLEHVTKKPETQVLKELLFDPIELNYSFYRKGPNFLEELGMPNYYMDRFGDGRLQNVSLPTRLEIYSEYGDGGLVATSLDFVKFMDALVNTRIVGKQSLALMNTPAANSEYGLGFDIFNYGGTKQYGHQGAVFGGSSLLLYFEKQQCSVFIAANCDGAIVGGKTLMLYHEMKNKICELIAAN